MRSFLAMLLSLIVASRGTLAADLPVGVKTISDLPRSEAEVMEAHERSKLLACDYLSPGMPLELNSFVNTLTERDRKEKLKAAPNPSTRRQVLTIGVQVAPEDVSKLPKLSSSTITDYLNKHYVSLQAKIQKDSSGALYLHHRLIAATSSFGGAVVEEFSPSVAGSIREIHSLGIFLPPKTPPTPDNLRTAVFLHKHIATEKNIVRPTADRLDSRYEFIFIRGRASIGGNKLDLHVFGTSEERKKLHYFRAAGKPSRPADCTLKAEVLFTRYSNAGLMPEESAVRRFTINSRNVYDVAELDAFVKRTPNVKGDCFDNLNLTLDAIIDGRVRPISATPATTSAPPK